MEAEVGEKGEEEEEKRENQKGRGLSKTSELSMRTLASWRTFPGPLPIEGTVTSLTCRGLEPRGPHNHLGQRSGAQTEGTTQG